MDPTFLNEVSNCLAKDYQLGFEAKWIIEGRVKLLIPARAGEVDPSKLPVFYNPASKISRDVAVLITHAYFSGRGDCSFVEPLAGCGARAVRLLVEPGVFAKGIAGDINVNSYKVIKINAEANGVGNVLLAERIDANLLLAKIAVEGRVDYVDVDPSGSPARYLENAYRSCRRGGLLGASATDLAALSGVSSGTSVWRYGIRLVKTVFPREVAMRALASFMVFTAARLGLCAEPVLTIYHRHFIRIFTRVEKGITAAKQAISKIGYVSYCKSCFLTQRIDAWRERSATCQACGEGVETLGPLWLGDLSDQRLVRRILESELCRSEDLRAAEGILRYLAEEPQRVFLYYPVGILARIARTSPPSPKMLVERLREIGYQAAITHHDHSAIKTDAPIGEVIRLMKK